MAAGDQGTASTPLSQAQVLSELDFLATVEHALIVEALSVSYAFGTDLGADEGGALTDQGRAVADAASSLLDGGGVPTEVVVDDLAAVRAAARDAADR